MMTTCVGFLFAHLCDSVVNDLLVGHIALVADEQLVDALSGVSVNLLQPLLHVVERVHVGDIVNDADTMGTTVVRGGNGSETFLTSGIPLFRGWAGLAVVSWRWLETFREGREVLSHDLQLHSLAIKFDGPNFLPGVLAVVAGFGRESECCAYEVDTDCGDVGLGVGVVGEPQQQARLSNTGVTDEEQLEEVVVSMKCQQVVRSDRTDQRSRDSVVAGLEREGLCKSVSISRAIQAAGEEGGYQRDGAYYSGFMMAVLQGTGCDEW